MMDNDYDVDDARIIRRPRNVIACGDGFCGADDCPRCHPEHFDADMRYVGEDDDAGGER